MKLQDRNLAVSCIVVPMNLNKQIFEALSWSIAAEFHRRHPEIDPHFFWRIPGAGYGGYYNFGEAPGWGGIGVDENSGIKPGIRIGEEEFFSLQDLYATTSLRDLVKEIERRSGLPSPEQTPETTSSSIGFRLVAHQLTKKIFHHDWTTAIPNDFTGFGQHYGPYEGNPDAWWANDNSGPAIEAFGSFYPNQNGYNYQNFIWKVATFRDLNTEKLRSNDDNDSEDGDAFFNSWKPLQNANLQDVNLIHSIWIAPNTGKAFDGKEIIDLLEKYRQNKRSIEKTCTAIFNS